MWQDPSARYRFKLHRCKEDSHYHLITGIENISWPFWSREAGLKLVDFSISLRDRSFAEGHLLGDDLAFEVSEFDRLREEITALPGLPPNVLYHEGNVATFWSAFLRGENQCMCYMTQTLGTAFLFPLYCDFVHRSDPRPSTALGRTDWIKLAEAPVIRNTMEDLGIKLEPA